MRPHAVDLVFPGNMEPEIHFKGHHPPPTPFLRGWGWRHKPAHFPMSGLGRNFWLTMVQTQKVSSSGTETHGGFFNRSDEQVNIGWETTKSMRVPPRNGKSSFWPWSFWGEC